MRENISSNYIITAKLLHFSTIWKDFPGCSVICRLSAALSAAWIPLGSCAVMQECLQCANIPCQAISSVPRSCWELTALPPAAASALVLLSRLFLSYQHGRMNQKRFDLCLVRARQGWTWAPPADPFLLLGLQGWIASATLLFWVVFLAINLHISHPTEQKIWTFTFIQP